VWKDTVDRRAGSMLRAEEAEILVYSSQAPSPTRQSCVPAAAPSVELGRAGFTEDKEQPGLFQKGTERLSIRTHQDSEGLMVGLSRKLGVQPE